jgi:uncharacterized protein YhaN
MSRRRVRAILACVRDARAAELLRTLLAEHEKEQSRLAELQREVRELRLMVRKLCQVANVPRYAID